MSETRKAKRHWRQSFFTRAIAFRFLLTPIGTIRRAYNWDGDTWIYIDMYIFGIRVARIHL